MRDRWINSDSEEDLKPFLEPELDIRDQRRIGKHVHTQAHTDVETECVHVCVDVMYVCGQTLWWGWVTPERKLTIRSPR